MTITAAEQTLIALLRENARMSVSEIARRLGVSRSTAQSRLERLERSGVVAGYSVRLSSDYAASQIRAHLLATFSPKLVADVIAAMGRIPAVRTVHSVSGSFDMIIIIEAPSVAELDAIIDTIGAMKGVDRTMSSIILSTRIDH